MMSASTSMETTTSKRLGATNRSAKPQSGWIPVEAHGWENATGRRIAEPGARWRAVLAVDVAFEEQVDVVPSVGGNLNGVECKPQDAAFIEADIEVDGAAAAGVGFDAFAGAW